jgi:sugar phosphate isomerase/epimerase
VAGTRVKVESNAQYGKTTAEPQAATRLGTDEGRNSMKMKLAVCNEMFGNRAVAADTFSTIRKLGYTGVEIAPFTLLPDEEPFDVRNVPAERIVRVRDQAATAGLEVVGLHWLLAKTEGLHVTSPDPTVRRHTGEYLRALAELCADLGGKVLVLGSPQQRNLLPGVSYEDAEAYATEVLHLAMSTCARYDVTIALEPLGPAEGDFLLDAEAGIRLVKLVGSPHCGLQLDAKAMASQRRPIPEIIRTSAKWLIHFHANDPNLLGPGMGELDFAPILAALKEINYDGWISVEPLRYEPSPVEVAQRSIEYLQKLLAAT